MKTRSLFRMNRFTPVVLLVALVASLVQVTPASAAGIVVNTSADNYANDGRCTLREAIDAANTNAASGFVRGECVAGSTTGVDTISFDPSFAPYLINVGSGGTALKQLPHIVSPITITGLGAADTVLQAAATPNTATWRIFQVFSAGTLTLDGVTVRNGRCNGSCTVVGNVPPDAGGGILNSGTLTIMNSVIRENRGSFGGGIFNNGGILNVINSTIANNNAFLVTTDQDGGGGIRNSGTLTITGSTISGNVALSGGGIFSSSGSLTVTNSTITGNLANETTGLGGESGGGIYQGGGTTTLSNSSVTANGAYAGGGIYNVSEMTIMDSTIAGNTADIAGGITNDGIMTITNSTILANTANVPYGGGGLTNGGTLTITNSTISGNSAFDSAGSAISPSVGGILNYNGNLTLTSSTISGNDGYQVGGILSIDESFDGINPTILRNTIVSGNLPANCIVTNTTITNDGNNLESGSTCGWGTSNDSLSNTDPQLGTLENNGGLTQTMKLLAGSPAIDAGNLATCPASDQRGVLRPLGAGCDIGAFETSAGAGPDTVGVFRPSNGFLFLKNINLTGFADLSLNYGLGGDHPVVGDWDGDGDDTIGVYRNGVFLLRNSNTLGFADLAIPFGLPGDQPVAGDWDGDGVDTVGVFRPSTGLFMLRNSNDAGFADVSFFLGNPGDVGIAGDWDGDGDDTTGVFRPSNGFIFLKNTNDTGFADIALNYGLAGDKPVTGDWNADGFDTIGVLRGNIFFLRNQNTNGFADMSFALGNPGDMPIAGNWDGQP